MRKEQVSAYSSINKIQIQVKDLRLGMYVCELDRPWLDSPFWFQGFYLTTPSDIKAVQEHCHYVYIDVEKTRAGAKLLGSSGAATAGGRPYKATNTKAWLDKKGTPPPRKLSVQEEIYTARNIHKASGNLIRSFMEDIKLGRGVSLMAAKKMVSLAVDSILHTPDALLWMTRLKHRDEYTAEHCLNVGILAITLGRHIGLSVEELNYVGLCGMMHDLGKMRVPLDILNKPGQLEADELKIMQNHTVMGAKMLMSTKNMYDGVIEAAHSHHERLDGSGYPRKLFDPSITPYTRMVTIVDMYDALTSARAYKRGIPHLEAIKILTESIGTQLDPELTVRFIECMGIYPVGTLVEMSTGVIGIVIEVHPEHKLKPKVVALLDKNKKPLPERVIDLAEELDAAGCPITIKKTINPDDYAIDINTYYENFAKGRRNSLVI
jgi:putative nucleotidyltransferase with HDIG domain